MVAETTTGCLLAGSASGKKGVPAEDVAKEALYSLIEDLDHQACVDQYAQDQVSLQTQIKLNNSSYYFLFFFFIVYFIYGISKRSFKD